LLKQGIVLFLLRDGVLLSDESVVLHLPGIFFSALSVTGFTHRWDATYGKLFYNHDTGAYIFKPDEDAIDPLSATVSQYTDIFVTDGIATTAGE
jgi:hypothetical protein